ncbi:hypothetical protein [Bradyrhizobium sp. DASA03120]|uniref:hypothetical protein n=1 Tax=Bradyrhizobium sp. SMVTL-02 TaxID=3395917 RepID=UPI003F6EEEB5
MRKGALPIVAVFAVITSNVYWGWANVFLACVLALGAGAIVERLIKRSLIRRAHAEMRRLYGSEWEMDN